MTHVLIRWAHKNAFGISKSNNFAELRRLEEIGYSRDEVCNIVAKLGFVDLFDWFISNGYKCNEKTLSIASENGNLAILKYALDKNFKFDIMTYKMAKNNNHYHILDWISDKNQIPKE